MKLPLLLFSALLGALAHQEIEIIKVASTPSTCPDGVIAGEIYSRRKNSSFSPYLFHHVENYFVCNRYPDGSSYGELRTCKTGDTYIMVGRRVGPFECTPQGLRKDGETDRDDLYFLRYPLRGGATHMTLSNRMYRDLTVAHDQRADEAREAVKRAREALGAKQEERPTEQKVEPKPANEIDPAYPGCDSLVGDCFPLHVPEIDPVNPDCDPLTQDCYFPNVPKVETDREVRPEEGDDETVVEPNPDEAAPVPAPTTASPSVAEDEEPVPEYEPLPERNVPTCTYNGVQAKAGQKFIVGELYVLKCRKVGITRTEIRLNGCLEKQARKRGQKKFPGTDLYFYRHSPNRSENFQCRGEFVPGKINVV